MRSNGSLVMAVVLGILAPLTLEYDESPVVTEPSTLLLLGSALIAGGRWARRRSPA